MFFWNSLAFSMIQWMLAIWSLVPLPFLKPAWTSGSSWFTYWWSLAWRILSIILLACEMHAIVWYFEHSLALPFFGTGKGQFSFQSQRKAMPKNAQTTTQLHSSHMLVKDCSKFSKPGLTSMWSMNFRMFKLNLEKAEKPEIKLPTFTRSSKKQESSRKTSTSALLTMPKPLTVWITINRGKFWKRQEYQTTWPASWEICMQVRKQQLELDMEQQTGSK